MHNHYLLVEVDADNVRRAMDKARRERNAAIWELIDHVVARVTGRGNRAHAAAPVASPALARAPATARR